MSCPTDTDARPLSAQVRQLLHRRLPHLAHMVWPLLHRLLHLNDMDAFLARHGQVDTDTFIEAVLSHFDTRYHAPECPLPPTGPAIVFANHPLGALDALALLHWVRQRRADTRLLASRWLCAFQPLAPVLIPVDNFSTRAGGHKSSLMAMRAHLEQGGVLILFPAGEVSRLSWHGIRDRHWHSGFARLARAYDAPLYPVRIHARNSALFYAAALLLDPLATLLLPHQMYARRGQTIRLQPGDPIAPAALPGDNARLWTRHLYQTLYRQP